MKDNTLENFPKYYTRLFNGITDALEALQKQNYIEAQDILMKAQQDAEEMYLEDGDEEEDDDEDDEIGGYSWQFDRIIKETEELERKSLIHESVELFRMLRQEKGTHPEDPPQNH